MLTSNCSLVNFSFTNVVLSCLWVTQKGDQMPQGCVLEFGTRRRGLGGSERGEVEESRRRQQKPWGIFVRSASELLDPDIDTRPYSQGHSH